MSQYVSHEAAAEALDSLDDYARMGTGVDAYGPRGMLERYIAQQAATLRQQAARVDVTEEMVGRAWMAYTGRDKLGVPYARDADCMLPIERKDMRAALEAALSAHRANYDVLVIRLGEVTARLEAADALLRECRQFAAWASERLPEAMPTYEKIDTHLKAADHV